MSFLMIWNDGPVAHTTRLSLCGNVPPTVNKALRLSITRHLRPTELHSKFMPQRHCVIRRRPAFALALHAEHEICGFNHSVAAPGALQRRSKHGEHPESCVFAKPTIAFAVRLDSGHLGTEQELTRLSPSRPQGANLQSLFWLRGFVARLQASLREKGQFQNQRPLLALRYSV